LHSALLVGLDRGTPDPGLCAQCQQLHLRPEDFHIYQGMEAQFPAFLGSFEDVSHSATECEFCSLVKDLLEQTRDSGEDKNTTFSLQWRNEPWFEANDFAAPTLNVLGVVAWTADGFPTRLSSAIRLIKDPGEVEFAAARHVTDVIDFTQVLHWLQNCDNAHGERCREGWWGSNMMRCLPA